MANTYWYKQDDKPLFEDILWSKPENKAQAKKLLILGGHKNSFTNIAKAYQSANTADIGESKIVMPVSLKKPLGKSFDNIEFVPSTPSGSIAKAALDDINKFILWADGTYLPGDIGKDSETTVLVENLIKTTTKPLALAGDALDIFMLDAPINIERPLLLVTELRDLTRLGTSLKSTSPVTSTIDLLNLIDWLHQLTLRYPVSIITAYKQIAVVANSGKVSTTSLTSLEPIVIGSVATVYWLQHPASPFEALTSSMYELAAS